MNDKVLDGDWVMTNLGEMAFVVPPGTTITRRTQLPLMAQSVAPPKWFNVRWVDTQAHAMLKYELKNATKRLDQALDANVSDVVDHRRIQHKAHARIAELERSVAQAADHIARGQYGQATETLAHSMGGKITHEPDPLD